MILKFDYSSIAPGNGNSVPVHPDSSAGGGKLVGGAANGEVYFGDVLRSQHGVQVDAGKLFKQDPLDVESGKFIQQSGNKLPGSSVLERPPLEPPPLDLPQTALPQTALPPTELPQTELPQTELPPIESSSPEPGQLVSREEGVTPEAKTSAIFDVTDLPDSGLTDQHEPQSRQATVVDRPFEAEVASEASNAITASVLSVPAPVLPEILVGSVLGAESRFRKDGQTGKQLVNSVVTDEQARFFGEQSSNSKSLAQAALDLGNTGILVEKSERFGFLEQIATRAPMTNQLQPMPNGSPYFADEPNLPPTPNTVANSSISTPLKEPGWGGEFVGRMSLMIKGGIQEASIQLNPAELGRIEIKLSTDGEQVKVLFTVQHAVAREAIEQAMPRLREMLEQGGLQLEQSDVADQSQSKQREERRVEDNRPALIADEREEDSGEPILEVGITAPDSVVDYYI